VRRIQTFGRPIDLSKKRRWTATVVRDTVDITRLLEDRTRTRPRHVYRPALGRHRQPGLGLEEIL
jgi:hypothetical protein